MKEPLLAIVIGFVIGLVITFGIWTANKSLKQTQNPPADSASSPTASPPSGPSSTPAPLVATLSISTPENEALFNTNSTPLTGTAPASSIVAITGGANEQILQADSSGKFETEITLESGYNLITVTAFASDGKKSEVVLTLTYTTAKI